MGSTVEKIEKNVATIKIEISPEEFDKAIDKAYNKNKSKYSVPGFRKGKVPRKIIERHYGEGVFYEDAIDFAFPDAYSKAIEEHDLYPVATPGMESIDQISSSEGLTMTISVAIKPDVELGEYKGTEIEAQDYQVTDEDVENELEKLQIQNARLVSVDQDTPAKEQDTINIDFEGFVDGEAFEGGKAENYSLTIGSKTFIPGFEEQLVGLKIGEEKDINVTFPEDYKEDLAGKPAVFKIKVNDIKARELPEIDDEFVKDVSEYDTLDEYKEYLKNKIREEKLKELKEKAESTVIKTAVDNAKVEIPEPMIREEIDKTLKNFEYRMQMQGISMNDYYSVTNTNEDSLREQVRDNVIEQIKTDLVLSKITEVENIQATEEAVEEEIKKYAESYKIEADKLKESMNESDEEYFKSIAKRKTTVQFLMDNAVEAK